MYFTGEQWLQPDWFGAVLGWVDWIHLSHLKSALTGRIQLEEIRPFGQVSSHVFFGYAGFLPHFKDGHVWVADSELALAWMVLSVSAALQTGDFDYDCVSQLSPSVGWAPTPPPPPFISFHYKRNVVGNYYWMLVYLLLIWVYYNVNNPPPPKQWY